MNGLIVYDFCTIQARFGYNEPVLHKVIFKRDNKWIVNVSTADSNLGTKVAI